MKFDLGGHSLGGAHAYLAAGMLLNDGASVGSIITCGCPAPGTRTLADTLEAVGQRAFHNIGDPVWDVPEWPFIHPVPAIQLNLSASVDLVAEHGLFAHHRISLYQADVTAQDKPFVDLIAAIYNPLPGDFDVVQLTSGIFWGLKKQGPNGRPVIIYRGSVTDEDWTRDFLALPIIEPQYWRLGMLHAGFAMGLSTALKATIAAI